MDYLTYWGLTRRPFAQDDQDFFFAGSAQREVMAGLGYFVAGTWNSAFLVAPQRSGATWLLRQLKQTSGFGDCAAEVILTSGVANATDGAQAAQTLAEAMGTTLTENLWTGEDRETDPVNRISRSIQASSQKGIRTVWLIDDCAASTATLARDLVMADGDLSVVMGTTPENLSRMTSAFGRCCMQIELDALDVAETFRYIASGLRHAEFRINPNVSTSKPDEPVFTDTAIVRMHEISHGRLAALAAVAEASLQLGAAYQVSTITPSVVETIIATSAHADYAPAASAKAA
ncbi:hypothetical protein [Rubripirellula reticaptiva]|uniref:AAA+ ATPase domain-containing protein n=1 Tax=Rubripirellula reticaptiva TaxID=2528013 RepID=A0A5C6EGN3_9BACT|nr:hypothetical protein [Rubripirellula reticaptiva]TWU46746.1 hypothetical protein Poly59_57190 [Rubripirellula reticaptiva]